MFHGGRGGLVAGSWILDMMKSPYSPPTPGIGTVVTRGLYPVWTTVRFAILGFFRHFCGANVCFEPEADDPRKRPISGPGTGGSTAIFLCASVSHGLRVG